MGRRSDHSREELRELILQEGHRQLAQVGFARFSAREVAKRIGYSIGTIYNVFGSYDALLLALNGRTLDIWLAFLEERLAGREERRLDAAIEAYFDFALGERHAWTALYDFRLPEGVLPSDSYREKVAAITEVIVREIAAVLPPDVREEAPALARSLLASVHGHCFFALNGTFAMLGEDDPVGAAKARVADALARFGGG
ncbi:TetR/AcrR family transcriptional regulator [Novosphingobium mangrovi (ex Huang et al. 2023)]|uniref:TetR/AcrR family transcriptional regulator n=1 Tax=Novosphingobium mangrovi (ex Huang et al. 2023) TaxID=2976432 RepID=A0ABT2I4T9_9SPHN|nr:TetR/AcrR family transcriptional regulator [Novosphingobium mangrovi (ex Huang et al. 2023)]MCT2399826.1 TetR/AcrR family transcriptional regulator [Novosphingobium mangrovi (ex Huang et al. 2023)]